jgi:hypothetical protein
MMEKYKIEVHGNSRGQIFIRFPKNGKIICVSVGVAHYRAS